MKSINNIMDNEEIDFQLAIGPWKFLTELINNLKEQKNSLKIININGYNCKKVSTLLQEFSYRFKFPDYFGFNFESLDECLNDLEWMKSPQYLVIIKEFEYLLVDEGSALEDFITILNSTVKEWNKGRSYDDFPTPPTPFKVIFHTEVNSELKIERIKQAGIKTLNIEYIDF